MSRIFKAGPWTGTYTRNSQDHNLTLQLEFYTGKSNRITGAGTCNELGYVQVEGTYTDSNPYDVKFDLTSAKSGTTFSFTGFREKQTNGIFGTFKVSNQGTDGITGGGNYSIKPAQQDTSNAYTSIQNNKRIQSYEEMGFTREQAERAVKKYASDEQALEWLFSSASSEEHNSPQTPPKQINVNASENEQTIMSMGFSQEQAKNALEMANGNVETAISILLDNM